MKQLFTLLAFVSFTAVNAQLTLKAVKGTTDYTNGTYYDNTFSASVENSYKFYFTNTGTSDLVLKANRENVNLPSGYVNYFCWDICYSPNTSNSNGTVTIAPADTFKAGVIYIDAMGNPEGNFSYTFRVFDANNSANYILVNIVKNNTSITVTELENTFTAYPNPANDQTNIRYNLNGASSGKLVFTDITGKIVREIQVREDSNVANVDVSDLQKGIYLYSLYIGNRKVVTKKIMIN